MVKQDNKYVTLQECLHTIKERLCTQQCLTDGLKGSYSDNHNYLTAEEIQQLMQG